MVKFVHDILERSSQQFPTKCALQAGSNHYTYQDVNSEVIRFETYLRNQGVTKGDRIVILLPNSFLSVISIFAASKLGAVFVHLNEEIVTQNLKHIIDDCEPKVIITNAKNKAKHSLPWHQFIVVEEKLYDSTVQANQISSVVTTHIEEGDLVCLIYTSGSTGKPKAVMSSHANVTFAANAIQNCIHVKEQDVIGLFLPFSFDYGMYQIFLTFQVGAKLVLFPIETAGLKMIKSIHESGITGLPIVPSMVQSISAQFNRENRPVNSLRFITSTGEKLKRANIHQLLTMFPQLILYSMYGLTECKRVSILPSEEIIGKIDSIGKPLPGTECIIINGDGEKLPPNEIGELVVKGPHVMKGYWNNSNTNTRISFGTWNDENVLYTGDMCSMDEHGYLYFHGREDDIFKKNGYRISSIDVETAVMEIPNVVQAALVVAEEVTCLFVVTDLSENDLRKELSERIDKYAMPNKINIVPSLPLTSHSKVDKKKLKTFFSEV
ncbi:class I adenylate-forming enzyme family protein [Paenibacillus sp. YSY-4.3]